MSGTAGGGVARPILVATRSPGKLHELAPLIESAGLRPIALDDAGIAASDDERDLEAHSTFEENALAKARHFGRLAGTWPVLADDSGLAVDALGGAPGVHSKRWSGSPLEGVALDHANNERLLDALAGATDRKARYVCVAAIVWPLGEIVCRGESAGAILQSPRGDRGFGYDPYFLSDELQVTFAEATREQKSLVSHRGRAVRAALAQYLERTIGR